jgi:hypothetical protein
LGHHAAQVLCLFYPLSKVEYRLLLPFVESSISVFSSVDYCFIYLGAVSLEQYNKAIYEYVYVYSNMFVRLSQYDKFHE